MRIVGVHPRGELERKASLFAALCEAFPSVRFEARDVGEWGELDALIELGGEAEARAAAAAGTRALAALVPEAEAGAAREVLLAQAGLDRRLRGQALPERHLPASAAVDAAAGAEVLATCAGAPMWTRAGRLDIVAVAPLELGPGEALRARLGRDRWAALLPLLELLREITAAESWRQPPLRASFMLDDPNLHWPSYGYLKLPELAPHAEAHGYHLALAMVPLDASIAHPAAARLLRGSRSLSLLVHGNDHFGAELGAIDGDAEALALAAQALRRIEAFERRSGIAVSRVMAPPHEECSAAMAQALARTGFEAITMTRPYPWLAQPPRHWLTAPAAAGALAGWAAADTAERSLPVLLRHPFAERHCSAAELALRAYLGQPLILYGHHDDLADGLEVLERRTEQVNRLGAVRWASLGEIAVTNFEHRLAGDLLRLRPQARRIVAEIPAGVAHVVVEPPPGLGADELIQTPTGIVPAGEPFAVSGPGPLELRLDAASAVSPDKVPPPPRTHWPLARRVAGEARDRAAPVARRLGLLR